MDEQASIGGDGSSWGTAYKYLQDALDDARGQASLINTFEIWVSEGSYYPDDDEGGNYSDNSPDGAFEMIDYVSLLGGFSGIETNKSQRDWAMYETILSGDIQQNWNQIHYSKNVIRNPFNSITPLTKFALISGFTIRYSNGSKTFLDGGAINNTNASIIIQYCTFTNNRASGKGGAIYNFRSNIQIINCLFYDNEGGRGHSIYNLQSDPKIYSTTFSKNGNNNESNIENENNSNLEIENSILWDNGIEMNSDATSTEIVTSCIFQGGFIGNNVLAEDPQFIDTANYDFRLNLNSPAIDTVSSTSVSFDLNHASRVSNDYLDLGAFESQIERVYVDRTRSLGGDGTSWGDAFRHLQDGILEADQILVGFDQVQIWGADGTYYADDDEGGNVSDDDREALFGFLKI